MPKRQSRVMMNFEADVPEIHIYDDIVDNSVYEEALYFCNIDCGCERGSCNCGCDEKVMYMTGRVFREKMDEHKDAKEVLIKINSDGGDLKTTLEMLDTLREHPAKITTRIIGMASSAASVIAVAGDVREIVPEGEIMIHAVRVPMLGVYTEAELRSHADATGKATESMIGLYANKTKASKKQLKEWLSTDTYFTPEEALSHGFVDAILPSSNRQVAHRRSQPRQMKSPPAPASQTPTSPDPYKSVLTRRRHLAGAGNETRQLQASNQ